MYARSLTFQLRPDMGEQTARIFRESVVPAAQQQKGFQGGLLLTDGATGKVVSISLWDTEEDLKAGETNGYLQEQIVKLAGVGLFSGPPARETFEVQVRV